MSYHSGFIAIIGSPNAGKSTLLNKLVGQKVSIVSPKAQTTRNRIMGVLSKPGYQIVFLDTPGITTPKNRLGEYMVKIAWESMNEVEAVLLIIDASIGIRERDEVLLLKLKNAKSPVIAVINKIDLETETCIAIIKERLMQERFLADIFEISALNGQGLEALESKLINYLPEGPQYFPEDMVTDQPERLVCAEIIREKALLLLREEIPHGIGVDIDKMSIRSEGDITDIWATIYCERESHKGIIIGKGGAMLKKIGTDARADIEWILGTRTNLQLWVKVRENWRNSPKAMQELGYN